MQYFSSIFLLSSSHPSISPPLTPSSSHPDHLAPTLLLLQGCLTPLSGGRLLPDLQDTWLSSGPSEVVLEQREAGILTKYWESIIALSEVSLQHDLFGLVSRKDKWA